MTEGWICWGTTSRASRVDPRRTRPLPLRNLGLLGDPGDIPGSGVWLDSEGGYRKNGTVNEAESCTARRVFSLLRFVTCRVEWSGRAWGTARGAQGSWESLWGHTGAAGDPSHPGLHADEPNLCIKPGAGLRAAELLQQVSSRSAASPGTYLTHAQISGQHVFLTAFSLV